MAVLETLKAQPASVGELFSNGRHYAVPSFQRDYAWTEAEWEELWADLLAVHGTADPRATHYLGAVVLQPGRAGAYNIIDGQQRLVTISLLALAVIRRIDALVAHGVDPEDNRERVRLLRERFVSTRDPASLTHRPRLTLNKHDDGYYSRYLVQGESRSPLASLSPSEEKLRAASQFFDRRLVALLGNAATGAQLAAFLDLTVANRLSFIEIVVQDDETAFTVFETLNARGVALGTADLMKNYLFSVASKGGESDLALAQGHWDDLVLRVPPTRLAAFFHYHLAATVEDLREKRVFAEVKRLVPGKMTFDAFFRAADEAADIYGALDDPEHRLWSEDEAARRSVRALQILQVDQCRSVLLAAIPLLLDRPAHVSRLLQNLVVISLRSIVARVNTGNLARAWHAAAYRIATERIRRPLPIARLLSAVTPGDDEFRAAFATLDVNPAGPRKKLVRYLLSELEYAAGGKRIDFEAAGATIEHVLPVNPASGWSAFDKDARARLTSRLGNLTPLEWFSNRVVGASDFAAKRTAYIGSTFQLTRSLADHEGWSPDALRARQEELAALAVRTWRIEDLDGD